MDSSGIEPPRYAASATVLSSTAFAAFLSTILTDVATGGIEPPCEIKNGIYLIHQRGRESDGYTEY